MAYQFKLTNGVEASKMRNPGPKGIKNGLNEENIMTKHTRPNQH